MTLSAAIRLRKLANRPRMWGWRVEREPTLTEWLAVAEAMELKPNKRTKEMAKRFLAEGYAKDDLWAHVGYPDTLRVWIGGPLPQLELGDTIQGVRIPSPEEVMQHPSYIMLRAGQKSHTTDFLCHTDDVSDAGDLHEARFDRVVQDLPLLYEPKRFQPAHASLPDATMNVDSALVMSLRPFGSTDSVNAKTLIASAYVSKVLDAWNRTGIHIRWVDPLKAFAAQLVVRLAEDVLGVLDTMGIQHTTPPLSPPRASIGFTVVLFSEAQSDAVEKLLQGTWLKDRLESDVEALREWIVRHEPEPTDITRRLYPSIPEPNDQEP